LLFCSDPQILWYLNATQPSAFDIVVFDIYNHLFQRFLQSLITQEERFKERYQKTLPGVV
jgi:hypothetical protein